MSVDDAERLALATASMVVEPGEPVLLALVRELGGPEFLRVLAEHADRRPELAASARRLDALEVDPARAFEAARRRGIRFVVPGDDEWPAQLDDLAAAEPLQDRGQVPIGLWVRGPLRLDRLGSAVAVVGSRSSTTYGDEVAADLAGHLGRAGRTIVSGGAFGIDNAAHRGALAAGAGTVAVLACGVDRLYPAAHRDLLTHLAEHHALVAEAPPGAAPFRIRFLARNRLIAGLAGGTVVVEAALRSGALNTANWAERMHRMVMAVPGSVFSAASQGAHQLLRRGAATLVTTPAEVLELTSAAGCDLAVEPRAPLAVRDRFTVRARQVLDAVPVLAPAPVESVALVAGLDLMEVRGILETLAGAGLVEAVPSGWRLSPEAPD